MLSRNRSSSGVSGYIRATCNPDADSWVADLIKWWWDPDTGYPIPERSGVVRYFVRVNGELYWGDTKESLCFELGLTDEEALQVKSMTFISSKLSDNKILMENDPSYLANLKALPIVEQERLLHGNWKIRPAAGLFFKRSQIGEILNEAPNDIVKYVRCWDLAATAESEGGEPAYTAGVLMGKRKNKRYVVLNVINVRQSASDVRNTIKNTCIIDRQKYGHVRTKLPQDPGQSGKDQAESYIKFLAGFNVFTERESGSKETRAEPFAAQWQAGNVDIVAGEWNESYLSQLESFPESKLKDMVDASSGAFNELEKYNVTAAPNISKTLLKSSHWRR